MNIVKISEFKNVLVRNLHNNVVLRPRDVIKVEFENGNVRYIDKLCSLDLTDSYFEFMFQKHGKEKIIFQAREIFE